MDAAKGILTARGGMTSHAAVVARGMGKPCVAGCESIKVDLKAEKFTVGKYVVKMGDYITIDGGTGRVILGKVPTKDPEVSGDFGTHEVGREDTPVSCQCRYPRDAKWKFGAEGSFCRTDMFFARWLINDDLV
jgi:pyruvate,orthophosphate dikinase